MLNPKYQRIAERIDKLIEEGKHIAELVRPSDSLVIDILYDTDLVDLHSWLTKTNNILVTVFGPESPHYNQLNSVLPTTLSDQHWDTTRIYAIIGVLHGALDDLKNGYLLGREFFVASEVFNSILEQSRHFLETGNKDVAAILARIVLEDALRRLARSEGIDDSLKASRINDELKSQERYSPVRWRSIQTWLDIGNSAAHGKFNEYIIEDVASAVSGIEQFLALEFQA